jgi:hypothetical protein
MKKIFLILHLIFISIALFAQEGLQLGKRNGSIFKREILPENIGLEGGYMKPIYFKANEKENWQRTGYLSNRLKLYLYADGAAKKEYKIYRNQAIQSQVLILPTYVCLVGFNIVALSNYGNGKSKTLLGAYFKPNSLAVLAAYFGCFYGSIYLNRNSETHLFKAVQIKNGKLKTGFSENGLGLKYVFQ